MTVLPRPSPHAPSLRRRASVMAWATRVCRVGDPDVAIMTRKIDAIEHSFRI